MNKAHFPELPSKIADPIATLYQLLDAQKEHSDSVGEQNSVLELQLSLQNVCHLARTAYLSSITPENRQALEKLIRKSFSFDGQLQAISQHYGWSQTIEAQMMVQMGLIIKVLSRENERLSH
ncbi:hypothetical protein BIY21_19950 [Vibrio ponticus]|uniref:Four helix bundle protein n=1 Tax=Vibrio ponticus TaxID=265668 RepID=A0ABX3F6Y7_9VIBR|nr:hypothetical protein [Vibrio ponticus]OLQ84672.1 hypothetical protein BIY21_19950 [Vibrio ponticus]